MRTGSKLDARLIGNGKEENMNDTLKKLRKIELDTRQIYEQGTLAYLRLIYKRLGVSTYRKALEHLEMLEMVRHDTKTNRELFEKNNDKEMSLIDRNALVRFGEGYIETALRELDKLEKLSKEDNK